MISLIVMGLISLASAGIIGLVLYAHIDATGTYQPGGAVSRGFTIEDGDNSDAITFSHDEIDPNKYYLSFPLYENTANVGYMKVLKIVPDGSVTGLQFSNIQRTANGITYAVLGLQKETESGYPEMEITTTPSYTCLPVSGNSDYFVNLRVTTGSKTASTESISFDIERCSD